jgi:hypothetical protein
MSETVYGQVLGYYEETDVVEVELMVGMTEPEELAYYPGTAHNRALPVESFVTVQDGVLTPVTEPGLLEQLRARWSKDHFFSDEMVAAFFAAHKESGGA